MKKLFFILTSVAFIFSACSIKKERKEKGEIFQIPAKEVKNLEGLRENVEMIRDRYGVVHIYGSSEEDLAFVQGYIHAHDRLFQMIAQRAAANGELSMLLGPDNIPDDLKARMFKFKKSAEEIYNNGSLNSDDKAFLDAYSEGVNAYIKNLKDEDLPLEFINEGVSADDIYSGILFVGDGQEGWSAVDTIAFARLMTFLLSFDDEGSWGDQFLKIYSNLTQKMIDRGYASNLTDAGNLALQWIGELINSQPVRDAVIYYPGSGELSPPNLSPVSVKNNTKIINPNFKIKGIKEFVDRMRKITGIIPNSNNWVVKGENTNSGNPILANDPHLTLQQPPVFHEAHLNTKEKGGNINAGGVMFPMAPGIVIGFTENIAWGETVVGYDVTDFYLEKIISRNDDVKDWDIYSQGGITKPVERSERFFYLPDSSKENPCEISEDVISKIEELMARADEPISLSVGNIELCFVDVYYYEIEDKADDEIDYRPIVGSLDMDDDGTDDYLITAKWTGFAPTTELKSFKNYLYAKNIDDFKEAVQYFKVGAQNQVIIDRDGNIGWFPHARIPIRYVNSCTNPLMGGIKNPPYLPQPGDGSCEWQGYIEGFSDNPSDATPTIPFLKNPDQGFIVTANNMPLPLTWPYYYHGTFYDIGYRAARITQRIKQKLGELDVDEMKSIQADAYLGLCKDFLKVITDTIEPDKLSDNGKTAYSYLMEWDCSTPSGYEYQYDPENPASLTESSDNSVRKKSIATTVFHAWISNLAHFTVDDHLGGISLPGGDQIYARIIYDIIHRKNGISDLWDDWSTSYTETMTDISRKAYVEAISGLTIKLGEDVNKWLWGKLHFLTLRHLADTGGIEGIEKDPAEMFNVPPPTDLLTAPLGLMGFPRQGGEFVVDASNTGFDLMTSTSQGDYSFGSGPSYRIIVEMTENGPQAYTAIPGGNEATLGSKYYDNQIRQFWWVNEYKKFPFTKEEVQNAADYLIIFKPATKQ